MSKRFVFYVYFWVAFLNIGFMANSIYRGEPTWALFNFGTAIVCAFVARDNYAKIRRN